MTRLGRTAAALLLGIACSAAPPPSPGLQSGSVEFQGRSIGYVLFVPSAQGRSKPLPTLLLLHGSGGSGSGILAYWQSFAEANGIVLVAPTLALSEQEETQVPQLFPALLEAAEKGLNVDGKRTYVFGYSAGGYFAFDAATLLSTRFAAATVFAAFIAPGYTYIVGEAQRKTPIAYYIGDQDQFFSLDQTRGTRDLLTTHGFPVHYVELSNQDHDYGRISGQINQDAWEFMSKVTLP